MNPLSAQLPLIWLRPAAWSVALRRSAMFAVSCLFWAGLAVPATSQDLALVNANVVDPEAESVQHGVLLIADGLVTGLSDQVPPGYSGQILDVNGGWVVPGFYDLHTHSFGNQAIDGGEFLGPFGTAKRSLAAGVVGLLDLFSPEAMILGFRDGQGDNTDAARLFAAGPCLTATEGHCSEYGVPTRIVDTPEDARREVSALAELHPDVVKLVYDNENYGGRGMPTVDRATMEAVVSAATDHGLPSVLHIGTWDDVLHAAEAGATAVTHTPGPDLPPAQVIEALLASGTVVIPTLAVQSELSRIADDPSLLDAPLLKEVASDDLRGGFETVDEVEGRLARWVDRQRSQRDANLAAVRALHDAGVEVLVGTDAGNVGVFQGFSVHREMVLLVEAGLSPWAALRAGSTRAGRFLGQNVGVGPGAVASLVVLDASPVDDISQTQRIAHVILNGRLVDRSELIVN